MTSTNFTLGSSADGSRHIEIHARGLAVLDDPEVNRGTAFTLEERDHLGLHGLLPSAVETMDEQTARCYEQFKAKELRRREVGLPLPAARQQRGALLPPRR